MINMKYTDQPCISSVSHFFLFSHTLTDNFFLCAELRGFSTEHAVQQLATEQIQSDSLLYQMMLPPMLKTKWYATPQPHATDPTLSATTLPCQMISQLMTKSSIKQPPN